MYCSIACTIVYSHLIFWSKTFHFVKFPLDFSRFEVLTEGLGVLENYATSFSGISFLHYDHAERNFSRLPAMCSRLLWWIMWPLWKRNWLILSACQCLWWNLVTVADLRAIYFDNPSLFLYNCVYNTFCVPRMQQDISLISKVIFDCSVSHCNQTFIAVISH